VDAVVTATNSERAAGRILSRRAVRRRGKTGSRSPHRLGDPRSSVSCAAVTFRARFTPLRVCHGAHRRASQNAPAARAQLSVVDRRPPSATGDMRRQRTCERRAAGDRRENTSQGRLPARSRTWSGRVPLSRRSVFPRRRAVRRAACVPAPLERSVAGACIETDHYRLAGCSPPSGGPWCTV
jgi:hypothetical protein